MVEGVSIRVAGRKQASNHLIREQLTLWQALKGGQSLPAVALLDSDVYVFLLGLDLLLGLVAGIKCAELIFASVREGVCG